MATVVITGANRGIGLALAKHYLANGDTVYGLCRNSSDELNSSGAKVIDKVDVGNPETLPDALAKLKDIPIDILINNAGVFANETLDKWDPVTIQHQFHVNALGPLLVTQCLLDNMNSPGKIILITSRMGSMEDNGSGGYYGYRMSKAALNAAGVSMAKDLKERGIAVGILHPGFVQTEMVNFGGDVSPEASASGLAQRIDELDLHNSGQFLHANGDALPW
ncbi:SDR family oxidoreductase [Aestuariibacter sp. AA17]|uniref:SDR family oxidoreductase n=1 Tax=Fluctibacter corallii TaxID=2984329 RepID=A0ABT3A6J9_9ALTE|nr:SDR family oxidoreductase [Aestuariibacter sp. AA17]MCV2883912.1 SDR family oxidoreductase [Aestuariibacter sp. AA17]